MINFWWVTRPKRKLNSIPEVLSTFAGVSLEQEWSGARSTHLTLEEALEKAGLKREGERRDQTGGGARTYKAWILSLGLIFTQNSTKKIKLTLAGEAIMKGDSPVSVLRNQVLKYQFPSYFSLSRGVQVNNRFQIRPFRFLLRLLSDNRIEFLTEEEIAKIIIVEAEDESDRCFEHIVSRLHDFRNIGDACLPDNFHDKYNASFPKLKDTANTFVNWLEYTQLIFRDSGRIAILPEKLNEVSRILSVTPPFIDRPEDEEYFQRKYGVDPSHSKDTRNLISTQTITPKIFAEHAIKKAYLIESLKSPITKVTSRLIDSIVSQTGLDKQLVEDTLNKFYPRGSVGAFMTKYFEMAFKGREEATDFELATTELFHEIFGYKAIHVGPQGLTPDVLIISDKDRYQAIIDNKAYSQYSISNDHRNRMIHNYIEGISNYSSDKKPLAFFSYIAGGFCNNINSQLQSISRETGIKGSAISVSNMIYLVEKSQDNPYSHTQLKNLFSLNRMIHMEDL